jgi:paraquat-inducible protein B
MDKIDDIFIEKAKTIRKEYLKCVENIDVDIAKIHECKDTIEKLLEDGDRIVELEKKRKGGDGKMSNELQETINKIVKTIENLQEGLQPYKDRMAELEKESNMLYISVSDRYPNLTLDEMKQQIIEQLER